MGLPVATKGDVIKIRYYQHADADRVRKLFLSSMLDGPDSPYRTTLNNLVTRPPYIVGYVLILSGVLASIWGRSHIQRLTGGAVAVVLAAAMALHRQLISRIMIRHTNERTKSDLADVAASYRMRPVAGSSCELEPSSRSAFWVAEASGLDGLSKEIVGCVGLDYYTRDSKGDPTSSELRHMVISPHHQRRGIGFKLLNALIPFARQQGLESIVLSTSSFQAPAVAMYQRRGWAVDKEIVVNMMLMRANILYLRLNLSEEGSS